MRCVLQLICNVVQLRTQQAALLLQSVLWLLFEVKRLLLDMVMAGATAAGTCSMQQVHLLDPVLVCMRYQLDVRSYSGASRHLPPCFR
jgi:hypothetical protein